MNLVSIGFFGVIGVLSRYLIDQQFAKWLPSIFPGSTLLINCLGSFLIGVCYVLSNESAVLSKDIALALMVGLLGGFTTFSAFSLQTLYLFEQKEFLMGGLYFVGSPVLGLAFAYAGVFIARLI